MCVSLYPYVCVCVCVSGWVCVGVLYYLLARQKRKCKEMRLQPHTACSNWRRASRRTMNNWNVSWARRVADGDCEWRVERKEKTRAWAEGSARHWRQADREFAVKNRKIMWNTFSFPASPYENCAVSATSFATICLHLVIIQASKKKRKLKREREKESRRAKETEKITAKHFQNN